MLWYIELPSRWRGAFFNVYFWEVLLVYIPTVASLRMISRLYSMTLGAWWDSSIVTVSMTTGQEMSASSAFRCGTWELYFLLYVSGVFCNRGVTVTDVVVCQFDNISELCLCQSLQCCYQSKPAVLCRLLSIRSLTHKLCAEAEMEGHQLIRECCVMSDECFVALSVMGARYILFYGLFTAVVGYLRGWAERCIYY